MKKPEPKRLRVSVLAVCLTWPQSAQIATGAVVRHLQANRKSGWDKGCWLWAIAHSLSQHPHHHSPDNIQQQPRHHRAEVEHAERRKDSMNGIDEPVGEPVNRPHPAPVLSETEPGGDDPDEDRRHEYGKHRTHQQTDPCPEAT